VRASNLFQGPSRPLRSTSPARQLDHRARGGPPMPRRSAARLSLPRRPLLAAHPRVFSTGRPSRFSSTSPPAPRGREFLSLQQRSESACLRAILAPLQRWGRPHKVSAPSSSGVTRAPRARSKAKGTYVLGREPPPPVDGVVAPSPDHILLSRLRF
jgi:hypothetical protein